MALTMKYKGYLGKVEYDEHEKLLHGRVVNTRDVITFMGRTVEETQRALEDSVEVYLEVCKEKGVSPEKPYSGNLLVRIDLATHAKLIATAADEDTSVNELAKQAIDRIFPDASRLRPRAAAAKSARPRKRAVGAE
jgi:predicted HicB family RNase H-like nuclease